MGSVFCDVVEEELREGNPAGGTQVGIILIFTFIAINFTLSIISERKSKFHIQLAVT